MVNTLLTSKRLELLKEAAPGIARVAVLTDPTIPPSILARADEVIDAAPRAHACSASHRRVAARPARATEADAGDRLPELGQTQPWYAGGIPRRSGRNRVSEGKNVRIEYRWAEGRYERLSDLAADLVRRRVDVIVATGGGVSGRVAKATTSTIPIVMLGGGDFVAAGLAGSLSHPGGNVTGLAQLLVESEAKRLQLLHELGPAAGTIAYLENPTLPNWEHRDPKR